jgi:hypothetical protein
MREKREDYKIAERREERGERREETRDNEEKGREERGEKI